MYNNFTAEKEYCSCSVIVQGQEQRGALLIGDFNSATDEQLHREHNIKTIITSASGLEHLQIPAAITHIVYPLRDTKSENIHAFFQESFLTIDRKLDEGGVLVHCAAGVSRSATLVIAYLMKKNQISFKSAISLVRNKRSGVCPNLGFQLQLKKYEAEISTSFLANPAPLKGDFSSASTLDPKKDLTGFKIENHSFFEFNPNQSHNLSHYGRKRPEPRKGIPHSHKHGNSSRARDRKMIDQPETELFITGRSTHRQNSVQDKVEAEAKSPMLGTWGPKQSKPKNFRL